MAHPRRPRKNLYDVIFSDKKEVSDTENGLGQVNSTHRMAHRLRMAVFKGASTNPKRNSFLQKTMELALRKGMRLREISKIVETFSNPLDPSHTYILQLRLEQKIYVVIIANCASLHQIRYILLPLLNQYNGDFVNVLPLYHYNINIEAILSYELISDFKNLESKLLRDSLVCKAKAVQVVDLDTGAINFKCDPDDVRDTCLALKDKGYNILHLECNFKAKVPIRLSSDDHKRYLKFYNSLAKMRHIIKIFDNVVSK
ncbi:uncharacterized protein LOC119688509 [Teleopsis dalmanni]|uniref:uncharacterized protein LOC119688509 n=1 Tax=Teleopsis dalmanni TaxID=139649 RepID=UPI0018CDBA72|nr:uncharacterized protein LOC119688509 [Teleopsis dalmanni]